MDEKYNNFFAHCNDLVSKFYGQIAEQVMQKILDDIERSARSGEREYTSFRMLAEIAAMVSAHEVFKDFQISLRRGYATANSTTVENHFGACARQYFNAENVELRQRRIKQLSKYIELRFSW